MTRPDNTLWHGDYKIPWHDPNFSRRMLAEHLTQAHDLASRRTEWIDRQVTWLHERLLNGKPAAILDLGCGPGFYSHRLAQHGHRCHGIDFGPASIEYALANRPSDATCVFELGDIRSETYGKSYDLAMILYGEMNVFPPNEAAAILRRAYESLAPGGRIAMEVQTAESVEAMGCCEDSQATFDAGLFADSPYHCRIENHWYPEPKTTVQTFSITLLETSEQTVEPTASPTHVYRSTTQAWPEDELIALLHDAGFADIRQVEIDYDAESPISEAWPCNTAVLALWTAVRNDT